MKAAIDALVTLIRGTSGFSSFIGAHGPFWDIAPEGTAFPYMVIGQVGGLRNLYGFNGGSYIERLSVQLSLYDTSLESLATNAETVCSTLDFTSLTISGQLCRNIMRLESPRIQAMGMDGSAQRVYQAVIQYRLNVQRTVGA